MKHLRAFRTENKDDCSGLEWLTNLKLLQERATKKIVETIPRIERRKTTFLRKIVDKPTKKN